MLLLEPNIDIHECNLEDMEIIHFVTFENQINCYFGISCFDRRCAKFYNQLKLNIIYTTNTVKMLWPMTQSVIANSEVQIRLVSNGCTTGEYDFLKDQASADARLALYNYGADEIQQHHVILNELYKLDQGDDYFCFMDSDIFATGPFLSEFLDTLKGNGAVFSCRPALKSPDTPEAELNRLQGRHFFSRSGNLVGGSYFAIYRRSKVDSIVDKYGVDFSRVSWHMIPTELQDRLVELELDYIAYDTAKLLNVLFIVEGFAMEYFEHPALYHLGGLSWNRSILKESAVEFRSKIEGIENPVFLTILKKRRLVANHFSCLIKAIVNKEDLPELPIFSSPIELRSYNKIRNALIDIYSRNFDIEI